MKVYMMECGEQVSLPDVIGNGFAVVLHVADCPECLKSFTKFLREREVSNGKKA